MPLPIEESFPRDAHYFVHDNVRPIKIFGLKSGQGNRKWVADTLYVIAKDLYNLKK